MKPTNLSNLFWTISAISLQGFGGVFPVAQRELVERHQWLTREQFLQDWAVAQVMPGPNVVNLGLIIGNRFFGFKGAITAIVGLVSFPLILVLLLSLIYSHFDQNPYLIGALKGMAAVAAGLIAGTSIKLAISFKEHPLGTLLCWLFVISCFSLSAIYRLPLIFVLLTVGILSVIATYLKIKSRSK